MEKDKIPLQVISEKLRGIVGGHNDLAVLAEFCEVMLKSKKKHDEVVSELEVFLNDSAATFADWLIKDAESEILSARTVSETPAVKESSDLPDEPKAEEPLKAAEKVAEEAEEAVPEVSVEGESKVREEPKEKDSETVEEAAEKDSEAMEKDSETVEEAAEKEVEEKESEEKESEEKEAEEKEKEKESEEKEEKEKESEEKAEPKDGETKDVDEEPHMSARSPCSDEVVLVSKTGPGIIEIEDDDGKRARARSPVSTDGREFTDEESPMRPKPTLKARCDVRYPPRARLVEKKVSKRRHSLGNALLMARAVKDATGATEKRGSKHKRVVKKATLRGRSETRRGRAASRSRSQRGRKRVSKSQTSSSSPSVESFSVNTSDCSPLVQLKRKRLPPVTSPNQRKRQATRVARLSDPPRKVLKVAERPSVTPSARGAKLKRAVSKRVTELPAKKRRTDNINADTQQANSELDDRQLDEKIARLERLERLQEETRRSCEELATTDPSFRMKPSMKPSVGLKPSAGSYSRESRTRPLISPRPTLIPRRPPIAASDSPPARHDEPFQVVKWRVIVDKLEVTADTVKGSGDPVKVLTRGEIIEQTSEQVMEKKVPMIPIAHPTSSKYPAPIGWVTLDTTSVGGEKCLEPGPAFIKGGKGQAVANYSPGKGKGKNPQPYITTQTYSPTYQPSSYPTTSYPTSYPSTSYPTTTYPSTYPSTYVSPGWYGKGYPPTVSSTYA